MADFPRGRIEREAWADEPAPPAPQPASSFTPPPRRPTAVGLGEWGEGAVIPYPRALVPIGDLGVTSRQTIAYAKAIAGADHAVVIHVLRDPAEESKFRARYHEAGFDLPLVILESPYHSLIGPLLAYIRALRESRPEETTTVVLPEYARKHWWEHPLHHQTARRIRDVLLFDDGIPGVMVASVPYHIQ